MTREIRQDRQDKAPPWNVSLVANLAGGMNTSRGQDQIADEEVVYCEGFRIQGSELLGDAGYSRVGSAVRGRPKGIFEHQTAAGITSLILITDATVYQYLGTWNEWQYVSNGIDTTLSSNASGGDTVLNVASVTGFTTGKYVGLSLDNGKQHQSTVTAVGATTVTIANAIPGSGVQATTGKALVEALALTGNDNNQVVIEAVPSNQWTVFTNGANPPHRYDGATVEPIPGLPSAGDVVCKTLTMFRDGFLVLGNMTEGGTSYPYRVRWPDTGDPTNWTTGDAGYQDLLDSRNSVVAMKPLANQVIIYRNKSFAWMEYVGSAAAVFGFRYITLGRSLGSEGIGAVSPNSVYSLNDSHIVMDSHSVYLYRGGYSVDPISAPIFEHIFGLDGNLDYSKIHRSFIWHSERTNELFFMYASADDTFPKRAAVLSLEEGGKWRIATFQNGFTAAGIRYGGDAIPWVHATTTQAWTLYSGSWINVGVSGFDKAILLLSETPTDGYVLKYDYISSTQDGFYLVPGYVTTKRFRAGDRFMLHDWVEFEYIGSGLFLTIVTDDGKETYLGLLPTRTVRGRSRIYHQIVSESIQYKIYGTSATGVVLGSMAFRWKEVSRWSL